MKRTLGIAALLLLVSATTAFAAAPEQVKSAAGACWSAICACCPGC